MAEISKKIDSCGYNPEVHILSFRHKDMIIVVNRKSIFIKNVKDEDEARAVTGWLAGMVNDINKQVTKQENE